MAGACNRRFVTPAVPIAGSITISNPCIGIVGPTFVDPSPFTVVRPPLIVVAIIDYTMCLYHH